MIHNWIKQHFVKGTGVAGLALLAAVPAHAAEEAASPSAWSNPVLIVLACISILLVPVIFALGALLKSVLKLKYGKENQGRFLFPGNTPLVLIGVMLLMSQGVSAQDIQPVAPVVSAGINPWLLYLFITVIAVELLVILFFAYTVLQLLRVEKEKAETTVKKPTLLEKLNASVPIEREQDVMLDHDYDGIRELDNNLPPWWKYGFYVSIVFAVVYLIHFHVAGSGKLQVAEYKEQLQTAAAEVEAYKKKAANSVDENNVTVLTDEAALASGKALFTASCAACHGQLGEGGVGPNLTDAYWLHGGSISDIFKSIKYGWPEKGMKSWERDLGAKQMHELSSYIKSLHGTNPPNGKEQQGELYEEPKDTAAQVLTEPVK